MKQALKIRPEETKHIDHVPGSMRTSCAPGKKKRVWSFIWKTKLLSKVTTKSSFIIHIALKNLTHFYLLREAIWYNSTLQVQCLFAFEEKKKNYCHSHPAWIAKSPGLFPSTLSKLTLPKSSQTSMRISCFHK